MEKQKRRGGDKNFWCCYTKVIVIVDNRLRDIRNTLNLILYSLKLNYLMFLQYIFLVWIFLKTNVFSNNPDGNNRYKKRFISSTFTPSGSFPLEIKIP